MMLTEQQPQPGLGTNAPIWVPQRSPLQELRDFPFFPEEEVEQLSAPESAAGPGWLVIAALAMLTVTIVAEIVILAALLR